MAPAQEFLSERDPVLPPVLQLRAGEDRGLLVVQDRGIFALLPLIVAIGLQTAHKHVHGDLHHVLTARTLQKNKQTHSKHTICKTDRPDWITNTLDQ